MGAIDHEFDPDKPESLRLQFAVVAGMTVTQALVNHLGIRVTRVLTDFSGWLILIVSLALTAAVAACAAGADFGRLVAFENFSGLPADNPVWPRVESLPRLFALGLLLPAYTITGFDASAHAAEETVGASVNVPRGIVRSVLVSGVFGWVMLSAIVLAMPDPAGAAEKGGGAAYAVFDAVPRSVMGVLYVGIVAAQYLCGLATVTSASRMAFAFARDGGLPASHWVRKISHRFRTPPVAIWGVAIASVLFTVHTPVYSTITAVCVIFLYVSYVLPSAIGLVAYGRWWTAMGPWRLGRWFRPLAAVSVIGCAGLIVIGVQPPNDAAAAVVGGVAAVLAVLWIAFDRRQFPGPPQAVITLRKADE
jgi:amino acid transporter